MKGFKYFLIFISGAISYQILIMLLASVGNVGVSFGGGDSQNTYGISGPYVKYELKEACNFLSSHNCGCEPIIRTNASCEYELNEFMDEKHRTMDFSELTN